MTGTINHPNEPYCITSFQLAVTICFSIWVKKIDTKTQNTCCCTCRCTQTSITVIFCFSELFSSSFALSLSLSSLRTSALPLFHFSPSHYPCFLTPSASHPGFFSLLPVGFFSPLISPSTLKGSGQWTEWNTNQRNSLISVTDCVSATSCPLLCLSVPNVLKPPRGPDNPW